MHYNAHPSSVNPNYKESPLVSLGQHFWHIKFYPGHPLPVQFVLFTLHWPVMEFIEEFIVLWSNPLVTNVHKNVGMGCWGVRAWIGDHHRQKQNGVN